MGRTDIVARSSEYRVSIKGYTDYVKVISVPLNFVKRVLK